MSSLVLQVSNTGSEKLSLLIPEGIYPPHTSLQTAFCEEFSFTVLLITKASQENTLTYYETLLFFAK